MIKTPIGCNDGIEITHCSTLFGFPMPNRPLDGAHRGGLLPDCQPSITFTCLTAIAGFNALLAPGGSYSPDLSPDAPPIGHHPFDPIGINLTLLANKIF